jgi:hypothetical protein
VASVVQPDQTGTVVHVRPTLLHTQARHLFALADQGVLADTRLATARSGHLSGCGPFQSAAGPPVRVAELDPEARERFSTCAGCLAQLGALSGTLGELASLAAQTERLVARGGPGADLPARDYRLLTDELAARAAEAADSHLDEVLAAGAGALVARLLSDLQLLWEMTNSPADSLATSPAAAAAVSFASAGFSGGVDPGGLENELWDAVAGAPITATLVIPIDSRQRRRAVWTWADPLLALLPARRLDSSLLVGLPDPFAQLLFAAQRAGAIRRCLTTCPPPQRGGAGRELLRWRTAEQLWDPSGVEGLQVDDALQAAASLLAGR